MSMRVAPSKMNLIRFKRTLAFLRRAHDLLEEKREILLLEVNRRIGEATKLRSQVNEQLREAYELLDAASVVVGTKEMSLISRTPRFVYDLLVSKKKIMGVSVPSLEVSKKINPVKLWDIKAHNSTGPVCRKVWRDIASIGKASRAGERTNKARRGGQEDPAQDKRPRTVFDPEIPEYGVNDLCDLGGEGPGRICESEKS
ncbi:MAG: hypothetical protein DSO08_06210 [Candidatus Methanomethylicota archaeon]|uniref:Uncharacterized protein n=1 Tax=Thermoproteota archaeon TaxID=2056631 RepID=A0A523B7Y0_9CREN|nr:MAG: hypothetical protein DSO08_06210 [Candidatus Verstraetearchaeota archaeon]